MKIKSTSVILALGILLMAGALGLVGYRILSEHNAVSLSGEIVSEMQEMIPQYKADDPRATGMGRDPLPMIEIEGVSLGKAEGLSTGRRKKGGELVQDAQEEGIKKHL